MDPIYLDGSSTPAPYDQIEIDDDEEDQLASDIDEQQPHTAHAPSGEELEPDPDDEDGAREGGQPQSSTTPNGKRKHQRKTAERVPGHTLLPHTRLENILRADGMRPRRMMSHPPSSPQSFRREWSNVERGAVCFVNRNSTSHIPRRGNSNSRLTHFVCRRSLSSVAPELATSSRVLRNGVSSAIAIWVRSFMLSALPPC